MKDKLEMMKSIYGAMKIDYRHNEGKRYFVYGFKNDEDEWDFDNGELLVVTEDEDTIKYIKKHFHTINTNELFCENCFKHKKVAQLEAEVKYWCKYVWNGFPKDALIQLQNRLLTSLKKLRWSNVNPLNSEEPYVIYSICSKFCMTRDEFLQSEFCREYEECIDLTVKQFAAEWVFESDEEFLEHYLADHIELIEEGMILMERQKRVDGGIIDILAKDSNDKLCVIELKTTKNDKNIVWQSAYYQSEIGEDTRVITIAPGYSQTLIKALENVRNTELKIYKLNDEGYLRIDNYEDNVVKILEKLDSLSPEEEAEEAS
ncbi:endonuclease NucS domain-containing protein [Viridibacillus arvi]|uniref:endonuclease NucS domain-containing protein n=1 Tax=Viridibacillus arvi TaxID=263475 RepID=UPI003673E8DE